MPICWFLWATSGLSWDKYDTSDVEEKLSSSLETTLISFKPVVFLVISSTCWG